MKKCAILVIAILVLGVCCGAADVFSSKISAQKAASLMPDFQNEMCKFEQNKYLKTSEASLKSGGDFKFIKDKGVIFETTYPIKSTTSYTSGQNKRISAIIKSITNKNYAYLEKNFDIYYTKSGDSGWILALKPTTAGQLKGELGSIIIYGLTTGHTGRISKMIIDTTNTKTTINFTNCKAVQ